MPTDRDYFIDAINKYIDADDYDKILQLIRNPGYSINVHGSRNNWTALHFAIEHNKLHLVELFLLMKANPYQPVSGNNYSPRKHAKLPKKLNTEGVAIPNPEIIKLFPDPKANPEMTDYDLREDLKNEFINKIKKKDVDVVEDMLSKGFEYNDFSHYEGRDSALEIAIKTGSFEIAVKLVKIGAITTDPQLNEWLSDHAHQPGIKPFINLLQWEKQKQIQMVEAFCNAPGKTGEEKLNAARQSIYDIQKKFDSDVQKLMDNCLKGKEWSSTITTSLSQHPKYPAELGEACKKMVALVDGLYQNEELSEEDAKKLIALTDTLIKDPNTHKVFLNTAKEYQAVAGGKLSAYMMLIAGWAAKILTLGYQGEALIKHATEKLERIELVEKLSSDSEAYTKNTPI
jgi:ankyrin repeat protein